jgi:hypothetical protein
VIERVSWRKPRYVVRNDAGHNALWARRRLSEALTGEIDGTSLQLQRQGRRRFTLEASGAVIATAEALTRGCWTVSAGQRVRRLRRGFQVGPRHGAVS